MSFARNATGVLLTAGVSSVLGIATSVVLARWLTVDDRGLYAVAITIGSTIMLVAKLGLPSSAVYRIRRVQAPPADVATTTLVIGLCLAVLLIAIAAALEPYITARLLEGAPRIVFYLALATVLPAMCLGLGVGLARAIDRFRLANSYTIAANLAAMVAVVAALLLRGSDLPATLFAFLGAKLLVTCLFITKVLSLTGAALRIDWQELRGGLAFAVKSHAQLLAGQLHERADIILIAWLTGDPQAVAFYTIAVGVVDRLKVIPQSIGAALFPRLSASTPAEGAAFTALVARHTLAGVALAFVVLAAAAPWVLPLLYGAPYVASVPVFLVLLPAMAFHSLYKVVAGYFMSIDRQQVNIYTQSLALVANVALNLLLIPRFGIIGAAVSSLLSYAIESLLTTLVFLRYTRLRANLVFLPQRNDIGIYRSVLRRTWGKRAAYAGEVSDETVQP
jgi:O-antigen/teichoic acid export membrane protein